MCIRDSSNAIADSKTRISQNLVSGVVGCPARSILISDYSASSKNPFVVSAHTFTATCNEVKYYCSYLYPNPVTCKASAEPVQKTKEDEIEEDKEMKLWEKDLLNKTLRNWNKPKSLDGMVDSEMSVTVNHKGELLNLRWIKPTNIGSIDRSIVKAFKKSSPFRIPPINTPQVSVVITFPAQQ